MKVRYKIFRTWSWTPLCGIGWPALWKLPPVVSARDAWGRSYLSTGGWRNIFDKPLEWPPDEVASVLLSKTSETPVFRWRLASLLVVYRISILNQQLAGGRHVQWPRLVGLSLPLQFWVCNRRGRVSRQDTHRKSWGLCTLFHGVHLCRYIIYGCFVNGGMLEQKKSNLLGQFLVKVLAKTSLQKTIRIARLVYIFGFLQQFIQDLDLFTG